jgi:hypothetical protein
MLMRASYPGYRRSTERELEKIWEECVFTFDASALLDLYRVTPDARDIVLDILGRLKERSWLTHQAGLEYYDNRAQVISTGLDSYSRIPQLARDLAKTYRKNLDSYRQYRWIEAERWAGLLDEAVKKIEETVSQQGRILEGFLEADPVEERLDAIFRGRVGPPYHDMHDIYARAEQRLQLSIPPGFKDAAEKKDFHRYGDIVLWFQLLDHAKAQKKNIVFVTSDAKTDWWLERGGKTVGPRPELLQEMHATAGSKFHMYPPDHFVEYAEKHLKSRIKPADVKKTAQELRAVGAEKLTSQLLGDQMSNIAAARVLGFGVSEYLKSVGAPNVDYSTMAEYFKSVAAPNVDYSTMAEYLKSVAAPNVDYSTIAGYLKSISGPKPDDPNEKGVPDTSTGLSEQVSNKGTPESEEKKSPGRDKPK